MFVYMPAHPKTCQPWAAHASCSAGGLCVRSRTLGRKRRKKSQKTSPHHISAGRQRVRRYRPIAADIDWTRLTRPLGKKRRRKCAVTARTGERSDRGHADGIASKPTWRSEMGGFRHASEAW